ncbi:Uncharacterised protein [uncultured archaeon]|nr:Uncharacterised protein [uncultured archaeon]
MAELTKASMNGRTMNGIREEIAEFAKGRGIRSLSRKDYRYLRCAASMLRIHETLSGRKPADRAMVFELALSGARADSVIERSGKATVLLKTNPAIFSEIAPLLEEEVSGKSFGAYIDARGRAGIALGKIAAAILPSEKVGFWESMGVAAFQTDTLTDYFSDKKAGLAKNARASDFARLARSIAGSALHVVRELGLVRTVRYLGVHVLSNIMSGLESEKSKGKEWGVL